MWETTTLYIELLVIGFEVSIWLVLFVVSLTGVDWLKELLTMPEGGFGLLTFGLVLAVAYLLGIVFDKVAHRLLDANREPLKRWYEKLAHEERQDMDSPWIYARFMVHEKRAVGDILYARSKVRILRASVLNVLLIGIAGAVFLSCQESAWWWLALVVGLGLWVLVCFAYVYTEMLYRRRMLRMAAYLAEKDK